MEEHCQAGNCVAGCSEDADCYPGDRCDADFGVCEQAPCAEAHRDCAFKEFCNAASGECYEAAGYYCSACNDDDDCGGESSGNHCYGGYCLVECTRDADCPAGFYCYGFVDNAGNVQYYQCFTLCEYYESYESRPRRPAAAPPDERLLPLDPQQRSTQPEPGDEAQP